MKQSKLTHGSLFSGIGGFELGAEMAGIDTLWNCEIEKFQGEILKTNFLMQKDSQILQNNRTPICGHH